MKQAKAVASRANIFAQPLQLNFDAHKQHAICIPFFITLVVVGIVCGTTVASFIDLFSYKKIAITGSRQLYSKDNPIQAMIPMMAVRLNTLSFADLQNNFEFGYLTRNRMKGHNQYIDAEPCTRNHWKDISDQQYNKYNVSTYYCPKITSGFQIKSYQLLESLISFQFWANPLNWEDSLFNNTVDVWKLEILLFSQNVLEKQKLPFKNQINYIQVRSYYYQSTTIQAYYLLTNLVTDYSFFPFSTPVTQTFVTVERDFETFEEIILKPGQTPYHYGLIEVIVQMGIKSLQYERNMGKVLDVITEAGGLYTSVFGILGVLVIIYYDHNLKLKLAENTFKKNKNSIKESDYGFFKSLGYGVSGVLRPSQNSDYGKDCKRIERNLDEVDSLVHIEIILKRLELLEGAFEYSSNRDEFACLSLLERSSVEKFQYKRVRIEYYDHIIEDRNSMTIKDARQMYDGLSLSLETFLDQRLKNQNAILRDLNDGKVQLRENFDNQRLDENATVTIFRINKTVEVDPQVSFSINKSSLNILKKIINHFDDIKAEAQSVEMTPEFSKVEVNLAKAFYKMSEEKRAMLQQNIPIIILHRLMNAIIELKKRKRQKQPNDDLREDQISDWDACLDQE